MNMPGYLSNKLLKPSKPFRFAQGQMIFDPVFFVHEIFISVFSGRRRGISIFPGSVFAGFGGPTSDLLRPVMKLHSDTEDA